MISDVGEILISEKAIEARVETLAKDINKDFDGKTCIALGILNGSFIFMADLVRHFDFEVVMDFMTVESYGGGVESSGVITIKKDLKLDVAGKNVLIIEDIVDSGRTLSYIRDILLERGARTVKICTLLDKPDRRVATVDVDYVGFEIEDKFVVGYGLDFADKYRNLPYVGVVEP